MGRLTEAFHMINCTPEEWSKYSKPSEYLHYTSREELKRLRKQYRNK